MQGSGDRLAGGAHKAQFSPAGSGKTQQEWDLMFDGFDPEQFKSSEPSDDWKSGETMNHTVIENDEPEPFTSTTEIGGGYVAAEITRESLGIK